MSDKMPELPEAAAYCKADDAFNTTAFAWPGTYKLPRHSTPLYTADQLHAYARQYAQQWREDAERLDFLIRHRARIAFGDSDDPREVIDAARAAREGDRG